MSRERDLLEKALDVLERVHMDECDLYEEIQELLAQPELRQDSHCYWCDGEYDAGERLAKLEQDPVAWMYDWEDTIQKVSMQNRMTRIKAISERPEAFNVRPLYTSPPKREPLSDDAMMHKAMVHNYHAPSAYCCGFRDAEKYHGIGEHNSNYKERHETFGEYDESDT